MKACLLHFHTATPITVASAWPWLNRHHHAPASIAKTAATTHRTQVVLCSASPLGYDDDDNSSAAAAAARAAGQLTTSSSSANSAAEEQLLALGRHHTLEGDLESAVRQFELAVSEAPRSAVCKAELGRALVRLGRPGDGFNCLVAAFGIDSLCPGVKDGFREYYRAEIEARLAAYRVLLHYHTHASLALRFRFAVL